MRKTEMKYKIGDTVTIKYEKGLVTSSKNLQVGKKAVIVYADKLSGYYRINLDNNLWVDKDFANKDEEQEIKPTKSVILTSAQAKQFDPVNKPKHYADRKYEVIDVIQDSMSLMEFKGFLRGNVLKYILRYQKKGGVQDLEKSSWYLQRLIEAEKRESECTL